jgi:hypothetical protein
LTTCVNLWQQEQNFGQAFFANVNRFCRRNIFVYKVCNIFWSVFRIIQTI